MLGSRDEKMKCWSCHFNKNEDYQFCRKCGVNLYAEESKSLRPMTEWESMKMSFYKSDKRWQENIRNRKIINGKPYMTDGRGNIKGELPSA